jgi:hypothetical protein
MNTPAEPKRIALRTQPLSEAEVDFLRQHGCEVGVHPTGSLVCCPVGTDWTYLYVRGEPEQQDMAALFQLTFPDGASCQEWYYPLKSSRLVVPTERCKNDV